jgi:hypothetical protein
MCLWCDHPRPCTWMDVIWRWLRRVSWRKRNGVVLAFRRKAILRPECVSRWLGTLFSRGCDALAAGRHGIMGHEKGIQVTNSLTLLRRLFITRPILFSPRSLNAHVEPQCVLPVLHVCAW